MTNRREQERAAERLPMKRERCGAKLRKGGRCKQPSGAGTDHRGFGTCKWHGGNTPSQRKAAAVAESRWYVATQTAQHPPSRRLDREHLVEIVTRIFDALDLSASHRVWADELLRREVESFGADRPTADAAEREQQRLAAQRARSARRKRQRAARRMTDALLSPDELAELVDPDQPEPNRKARP